MIRAKIIVHGGSQAIRIPKAFRFEGSEVVIERRGKEVVLRTIPAPRFESFTEIAAYLASKHPAPGDFPVPPARPANHERPAK